MIVVGVGHQDPIGIQPDESFGPIFGERQLLCHSLAPSAHFHDIHSATEDLNVESATLTSENA